jgi:tetratricopeptide (TPR) repeat protein
MRKLHDRQSRFTIWRQSGVHLWRLQFSGLIHCLFLSIFLFWGTIGFAQIDTIQSTNSAYRKAEVLFQASDWVNAAAEFKKLAENPLSAEAANYRLASIHQKIGKNNEALFFIDQALKLNPSEDTYIILKAQLLTVLFKYNEAGKYYFKAIEINPKFWSRYKEASEFFKYSHNSFDLLKICRLWEKQFLFRPEIAKAYIWAYQDLRKTDSIIFIYEKLNAKYPDQAEYYKELKTIYLSSKQIEKAQKLISSKYQFDTANVFYKNEIIQLKAITLMGPNPKQENQFNGKKTEVYLKLYTENKYQILQILNSKLYFLRAFKEPWSELQNSAIGIFLECEQNTKLIDSIYLLAINLGFPNYEIKRKLNETLGRKFYCSSNYHWAIKYYELTGELKLSNENEVMPYIYSLFASQNKEKLSIVIPKLIEAFPFAPINELVSSYSLLFENKNEELLTATSNLLRTRNLGNSWKNEFICLGILGNFNLKANPITQLDYIYTENINPPYLKPFLKYYQSQSNDMKALELLNLAYNLGQITQSEFQLEISILKK